MVKLINKLKNRKGFTLIELIVVLAVLAVIMAIAVPRFLGVQENAKISADYSTAAMLGKAAELYLANDDNTITKLNTEAAKGASALATELNTTTIEFKSGAFDGQEDTINFSETNGVVSVTVTASKGYTAPDGTTKSAAAQQLYPQ